MMDSMDKAIGIFDSGIGGLTVLKEIIQRLPHEDTVYLGDTARVPYGIRSPETITRYSLENATFLLKQDIKLLVVACNTASAISLHVIEKAFPIPMIGVLEPGAMAAVAATRSKKVGVIGTEATIGSGSYHKAIKRLDAEIEIISTPCPLFVPLVEEGWVEDDVTSLVAERYLGPLKEKGIDTLVLGCTHYPLLKWVVKRIMGNSVSLIDSARETAIEIEKTLSERGFLKRPDHQGIHRYFVTDAPERFIRIGEGFLGFPIKNVEKIDQEAL